jgi:hypothetical protein
MAGDSKKPFKSGHPPVGKVLKKGRLSAVLGRFLQLIATDCIVFESQYFTNIYPGQKICEVLVPLRSEHPIVVWIQ